MARKLILFFTLLVFLSLAFFINKNNEKTQGDKGTASETTPTPIRNPTEGWQVFESTKFGYSFMYPLDWTLLKYDETKPDIIIGTHSLMNYDPIGAEKFMDHGIVNWEKFTGDKVILKADLTATNLDGVDPDKYISEHFGGATLQPTADLRFGNLETFQYNTPDAINDKFTRSYIALYNDKIIWANVYALNQPDQVTLQDTDEWKTLQIIFDTFKFKPQE